MTDHSRAIINAGPIRLRGFVTAGFDAFAALWADPDVVRYIGGTPRARSVSWQRFLRNLGHWQLTGFGQ